MEVHHHPQLNHKPKPWREYFLEFLMIFLAVTMGFFAESFREHLINNEREKKYILSFFEDLKSDQKNLPRLINNINKDQLIPGKSLPQLFNKIDKNTFADSIYYYLRLAHRQQGIKAYTNDRTIDQIKNAGEMRLLNNKEITDNLIDYYKQIVFIDYLQQPLLAMKAKLLDNIPLILKSSDYAIAINNDDEAILPTRHLFLLNTDPISLNRILIQIEEIRALSNTVKTQIEQLLVQNKRLQNLITTKYSLEE